MDSTGSALVESRGLEPLRRGILLPALPTAAVPLQPSLSQTALCDHRCMLDCEHRPVRRVHRTKARDRQSLLECLHLLDACREVLPARTAAGVSDGNGCGFCIP